MSDMTNGIIIKGGSDLTIGSIKVGGASENEARCKCLACGHEERRMFKSDEPIDFSGKCPKCGSGNTEMVI